MATRVPRNNLDPIHRVVGNREPIGAALLDIDGDAIDVTGLTIVCRIVDMTDGTIIADDQSATIDNATSVYVSYTSAAADIDTAGSYAVYFKDTASTPVRRWPYDGARMILVLHDENEGG